MPPPDRAELLHFIAADPALLALLELVRGRGEDDPGHNTGHVLRVAAWTRALGGDGVDPREAVAAALLHDLVNLAKDAPERAQASERSAREARAILPRHGFDPAATDRIASAIRTHSFSRGEAPVSALGEALQDADRLEALGVIGVFRTISTGSRMGADYFDEDDPWARQRPLDDRAHSVDHFFTKLLRLPATFHTAAGRAEAERRVEFMRQLLHQLGVELGAPLDADLAEQRPPRA